jgi:uncharacterized protein YdeI (YjbR/CyaY-like superfamily)
MRVPISSFQSETLKATGAKLTGNVLPNFQKQGLIAPAGQKMIDLAKASGTWDALADVENCVIPNDLQQLFDENKMAYDNFLAFSPSAKKIILGWIYTAKRPETRQQRIAETVAQAEKNHKAYPKQ